MVLSLLTNPYLQERLLTKVSNKGTASVLPIEGAVITGRSAWAAKRTGILEFQERLFEEVTVAAVWFGGVKAMNILMEKGIQALQKRGYLQSIHTKADWSKDFMQLFLPGKKSPSILLSPIEALSTNYQNLLKTMGVKGVQWSIAISVPLFLCGYAIPKFNQVKTNWLLKTFPSLKDTPTHHQKGNTPSITQPEEPAELLPPQPKTDPPEELLALPPMPSPIQPNWTGMQHPAMAWAPQMIPPQPYWGQPYFTSNVSTASTTSTLANSKPRFGFSPGKLLSALSVAGHYVDNTAYGQMLVVDTGITGGRMWTAWPRSKYESFEYGARDGGSLFFYMSSVPLIMKSAQAILNSGLAQRFIGSNFEAPIINLDNQIANKLNQHLLAELGSKPVTQDSLHTLLYGPPISIPEELQTSLATQLRSADKASFMSTFKQELTAFSSSGKNNATEKLATKVERYLEQRLKQGSTLLSDDLEDLLKAIWEKKGVFSSLSEAEQFHLNTSAKLAFHHQAGLGKQTLQDLLTRHLGNKLPEAELATILGRVNTATRLGADRVIASTFQRSVNAAQLTPVFANHSNLQNQAVAKQADMLLKCTNKAVQEGISLESFAQTRLQAVIQDYTQATKGQILSPERHALTRAVSDLQRQLSAGLPLSEAQLNKLANLLDANGRKLPGSLRWLEGMGFGHLSNDIRMISPLFKQPAPAQGILTSHITRVMEDMASLTQAHPNQNQLIRLYQTSVNSLLSEEGRFSVMVTRSMAKSPKAFQEMLGSHIQALLQGGFTRNEQVYKKALKILGQESAGIDAVKPQIDRYLQHVEKRFAKVAQGKALPIQKFESLILKPLQRHNAFWRNSVWSVALVTSMIGVGFFIPKMQYLMTKILTGEDTHPGLAAVTHQTAR